MLYTAVCGSQDVCKEGILETASVQQLWERIQEWIFCLQNTHVPRLRIHLSYRVTYGYLLVRSSNFTLPAFVFFLERNTFKSFIQHAKPLCSCFHTVPSLFWDQRFYWYNKAIGWIFGKTNPNWYIGSIDIWEQRRKFYGLELVQCPHKGRYREKKTVFWIVLVWGSFYYQFTFNILLQNRIVL